jgi:hypothetical protein
MIIAWRAKPGRENWSLASVDKWLKTGKIPNAKQ